MIQEKKQEKCFSANKKAKTTHNKRKNIFFLQHILIWIHFLYQMRLSLFIKLVMEMLSASIWFHIKFFSFLIYLDRHRMEIHSFHLENFRRSRISSVQLIVENFPKMSPMILHLGSLLAFVRRSSNQPDLLLLQTLVILFQATQLEIVSSIFAKSNEKNRHLRLKFVNNSTLLIQNNFFFFENKTHLVSFIKLQLVLNLVIQKRFAFIQINFYYISI